MDRTVVTDSGRDLRVFDSGTGTVPVLSIHGGGMGRTVYPPYLAMATERGVRVVSYDRPGLGGSTRHPGYRIRDCADDVRTIASALGVERMLVWGVSGGAPFALACAALLPGLVVAAAALGGRAAPAPDAVSRFSEDPDAAMAEMEAEAAAERERPVSDWIDVLSAAGLPEVDIANLKAGGAEWYAGDARDALAVGGAGYYDEARASHEYWDFDLNDIHAPVLIVHGTADPWVDPQEATELAASIPGAELRLLDGIGHLSLMDHLDGVVDWLLSRY